MRVADLLAKRGSNQREMSSPGRDQWQKKNRQDSKNPAALLVSSICAQSQDDHVINHTQIASADVINKHASARFDRGLDDFS